jgi:hypothetical protein
MRRAPLRPSRSRLLDRTHPSVDRFVWRNTDLDKTEMSKVCNLAMRVQMDDRAQVGVGFKKGQVDLLSK